MNRKLLFSICCLLFTCCYSIAQPSWQWGKRGGSAAFSGMGGYDETVKDVATDPNGNVYVLSDVWGPTVDVDGVSRLSFGGCDIMLSSFKCDGTYRWSKIIGGHQSDYGVTVKTDAFGGVYVSGYLVTNSSFLALDPDTSWSGGIHKTLFLAKFDTGSAYKWLRLPQADSVTGYSGDNSAIWDMDIDGAGNIYWFVTLAPGAYADGAYVVTTKSQHVLKFNSSGFFVSGAQLQMTVAGAGSPYLYFKRNHSNGKLVVSGSQPFTNTLTFGTTTITHTLYLGCFDSTGGFLWVKQNKDNSSNGPVCKPDIDGAGNIYLTTQAVDNDTFCAYVVHNGGGFNGTALVLKLDPAGNNIWGTNALANGEIEATAVCVNGSEVVMAGAYPAKIKWGSDSLMHATGCGYSAFITRFNAATGVPVKTDSLDHVCSPDHDSYGLSMTADKLGNFYLGGFFQSPITIAGTSLPVTGGGSDFFIAKYGTNNCNLPTLSTTEVPATSGKLRIYPNPVTNELTIENTGQECVIRMFNIMGQQVYSGTTSNNKQVVRMADFVTGTYLLQLTDSKGNRTTKTIVKQ